MLDECKKVLRQRQNAINNQQGHCFEAFIKAACEIYKEQNKAAINKTPEPFRVTKKHPKGTFTGRFTAPAQPDFQGTLTGGRSICFEAKYTTMDEMKRSALTDTQMATLEHHYQLGAIAGICVGLQEKFFFVPWFVWRDMKAHYKRQYVTAEDLVQYRVKFTGAVMFMDYLYQKFEEVFT